jgi:iron complex outermembrane receptor protein
MKQVIKLTCLTACAGMFLFPAAAIQAQDADDDSFMLEEVIVTARKREESLQEIPIAISVFNEAAIVKADLTDLEDISNMTPGFQFMNQGNQQPGRYNTQLAFRGLTTAQFSPSFATGALFIDGIYVLNGGTSLSLMDLERVEVIKGPQAAYFGRNTFGGAVNMITRDPNMQEFSGEVRLRTTTESNNDVNAFIEGPIISDKLSFSLSGRYYDKKGQYTATDGGRTGDEETTTINAVIKWEPTENLSFKVRYAHSEDDDGPPSQAYISGVRNDTCTGTTIETAEGTAHPKNYICGPVPGPNSAIVHPGSTVISSNTILPAYVIAAGLTNPDTLMAGVQQIDYVGLLRETERFSIFGAYDINDYQITASYGSNKQKANWIRDFDLSDRINWFSRDPQKMDDQSFELRLTSPQDQRLRWLVGVNSYKQEFNSSGAGGDASTSCFSVVPTFTDDFPAACLGGAPGFTLLFPNTRQNDDEAKVTGIFASLDFDINDQWTAILEGRWTEDKLIKGAGLSTAGAPILEETYSDFLPRAIIRWEPTDSTNLYLSYSEAQIAGDFNTFLVNADDRERAQYLAKDPTLTEALDAETLEAWEIGWKQGFAEGRGQVNFSVYHYTWKNIKGRSSFVVNETCRAETMDTTGCQTAIGQEIGDGKMVLNPSTMELELFFNSRNMLIPGDATIKGAELETWFAFTDSLVWTANLSYIDSAYDDYEFNFVAPIADYAQMAGNQTPRQPKWSGNTSLTYDFAIGDTPSYARLDWIYQGKSYVDESNLAYLSSYNLVNIRAGMNFENWMVELFVSNLFDEDSWASGARWTDFSTPTQFAFLTQKQGVAVAPLDKREFGVRVNWRF